MSLFHWVKYNGEYTQEMGQGTWEDQEKLTGAAVLSPVYSSQHKWQSHNRVGINGRGYYWYKQYPRYAVLQKQIENETMFEIVKVSFLPQGKAIIYNLLGPGDTPTHKDELISLKGDKYKWFTVIVLSDFRVEITITNRRWDREMEKRRNNVITRKGKKLE